MSLLDQVDSSPDKLAQAASTDHSRIAVAIEKIRAAGFTIQLLPGEKLLVTPRSQLSEAQVAWITKFKSDILSYLRSLPDANVKALQEQFDGKVESIALPAPVVEKTLEPKKELWGIRCLDCQHGQFFLPGDETGGWRLCEAGLGGYFALKRRLCDSFLDIAQAAH